MLLKTIEEWKKVQKEHNHKTVGFVPTMGNLHAGHVSLLRRSVAENDITVMSCYINPTQFNNQDDFDHYPKTLADDACIAKDAGVDYVFVPNDCEMYPDHYRFRVCENKVSQHLEGKHRPGHFEGMMTVVLKLLLLIRADRAYFGEKDYQQLQLVRDMVDAFFIDTTIVACPTVRNKFALPLSSRNRRLTDSQMRIAEHFPALFHSDSSCEEITAALREKGFIVEYVEEFEGRRFAAVRLDDVRLIDNLEIMGGE